MAKVLGLPELQQRLHKLSAEVAGNIARQAVVAGAGVIKRDARRRALPIAEEAYFASGGDKEHNVDRVKVAPGNVPKNIIMKRMTKTAYSAHYIVTIRGKKKYGYAKRVGSFLEHGTVNQAARPFLGPALSENVERIKKVMARRLQAGLKKAGAF
jgi:HK97 gp10 family phage protein